MIVQITKQNGVVQTFNCDFAALSMRNCFIMQYRETDLTIATISPRFDNVCKIKYCDGETGEKGELDGNYELTEIRKSDNTYFIVLDSLT